jgi:hypothetical protein
LYRKHRGEMSPFTVQVQIRWARLRAETGLIQEAFKDLMVDLPKLRKVSPKGSYYLRTSLVQAARIFNLARHYEEAKACARESLEIMDQYHLPEVDVRRPYPLRLIGDALIGQKNYRDAIRVLEQSEALYQKLPNQDKNLAELRGILSEARQQSSKTNP